MPTCNVQGRIPLKNGDEYDALTGWKRVHSFRAGQKSRIKRQYRRRLRAEAKRDLRDRLLAVGE